MADELDAIVQRILVEERNLEQEEENNEVAKKEEAKNPDVDKRKRKNRMRKEKKRAAKDRKICNIYIQCLQFYIEQSVQEEEEKDKWKKMSREIQTGKRQSDSAGAGAGENDPPNLVPHDVEKGKKNQGRMGGDMKEERSGSSEWEGNRKVLVRTRGHKSKYFVVDLEKNIIEMQHPYRLLGDGHLGSAAVFREEEDRMIVYEFGGRDEVTFKNFKGTKKDDDHIILHSFSGTSKSILNLKTNPPTWSKWEDCRAETTRYYWIIECSVTLGNKIFAFGGNTQVGQVYDTSKNNPEWEDMTYPFLDTPPASEFITGEVTPRCPIVSPIVLSDPKNNRLILCFEDYPSCLYAYYPDNDKESQWECLDNDLKKNLPIWSQQLVDDVIYYFGPPYTFLAYDITQKKWLNISWPENKLEDCDMYFKDMSEIIHLGDGIMCLAISYPAHAIIGNYPLLQFLRFRVSRVDDDHVQFTPISYHKFTTHPGRGWIFTPF